MLGLRQYSRRGRLRVVEQCRRVFRTIRKRLEVARSGPPSFLPSVPTLSAPAPLRNGAVDLINETELWNNLQQFGRFNRLLVARPSSNVVEFCRLHARGDKAWPMCTPKQKTRGAIQPFVRIWRESQRNSNSTGPPRLTTVSCRKS